MRTSTSTLLMAGLLVSCGGPAPGASSSFGVGAGPASTGGGMNTTTSTTGAGASSSTGPALEDSSTGGTGAGGTTGPLRDVGGADLGSLHPAGCEGKIDFLFVISRYAYMESMQTRLIEAFPDFIATIESKFADFDYHIMVVDGDDTWGSSTCNADCSPNGCPWEGYPCDSMDKVTACDTTMGAGTVFPAGEQATNAPCAIAGGRRYLTNEQPNLAETFSCMAQIGHSGNDLLAEPMVAAISPELNGPGGCNEGFLRDDALLMVTFISSTADTDSAGKPQLWADAVLEAKHGDPNAVVLFTLTNLACTPWDRICDLVMYYFPHWYVGNEDDADYGPAFEIATDRVVEACSEFIPL